jgi:hypothetical protein
MSLIRTARKDSLPKDFSYPLGAEAISEAFRGIPQFGHGKIVFKCRDEFSASLWRRRIQSRDLVTLLEIRNWDRWDDWSVCVYAVPAKHETLARERLGPELARVREELSAAANSAKSFRTSVTLDLAAGEKESAKPAARTNAVRTAPPKTKKARTAARGPS